MHLSDEERDTMGIYLPLTEALERIPSSSDESVDEAINALKDVGYTDKQFNMIALLLIEFSVKG